MSTEYISDLIPGKYKQVSRKIGLVATLLIQTTLIMIYAAHVRSMYEHIKVRKLLISNLFHEFSLNRLNMLQQTHLIYTEVQVQPARF